MAVNNIWPEVIVAVVLMLFGATFMASHVRSWRRHRGSLHLDSSERAYFEKRYRRRMRTSAAIIILGILIGLGGVVLPKLKNQPLIFTFYVLGLLVLTGWVMLQGLGDLWSTATYTDAELTRIRNQRHELERQLVEFKHRNLGDREFDGTTEP
jgi:phosphatidylglycerophosphate synthase